MRVNTRYIISTSGTSSKKDAPAVAHIYIYIYPTFQAHSATQVHTVIRQNQLNTADKQSHTDHQQPDLFFTTRNMPVVDSFLCPQNQPIHLWVWHNYCSHTFEQSTTVWRVSHYIIHKVITSLKTTTHFRPCEQTEQNKYFQKCYSTMLVFYEETKQVNYIFNN